MKKKCKQVPTQRGAALIELIISVLVVGLVLTAVATTITYSIRVTSAARKQDLANSIAQNAIEAMHRERALVGWNTFYAHFSSSADGFYCVDPTQTTFPDMFVRLANEAANVTTPVCREEVAGLGVPFYEVISISTTSGSRESVEVRANVLWDYDSATGHVNMLRQPVLKIFRETE